MNLGIILLVINSFFTVGLIFNQNESSRDAINTSKVEIASPLENLTWFAVIFEFILLLLKSKFNDLNY
jgi:hypothetical protein